MRQDVVICGVDGDGCGRVIVWMAEMTLLVKAQTAESPSPSLGS